MVIEYEVSLDVDAAIADDYLAWLHAHVDEILALPGFIGANILSLDVEEPGRRAWCVRYRLTDRSALEAYFREHAARMREDGVRRFGGAFRASRRILSPLES